MSIVLVVFLIKKLFIKNVTEITKQYVEYLLISSLMTNLLFLIIQIDMKIMIVFNVILAITLIKFIQIKMKKKEQ